MRAALRHWDTELPCLDPSVHSDSIWIALIGFTRRLGITQEDLYDRFNTDRHRVKKLWSELAAENEKAAEAK